VVLTALEAAWLVKCERAIVADWNGDGILPAGLVSVLAMMRVVASEAGLVRPARLGVQVPKVAAGGSVASVSVVTVHEAAERLGISEQAITRAIRGGRLAGSRVGRGAWEITSASVQAYPHRRVREAS